MAKDREQSRQSLYFEVGQVVEAVDGAAAQARIDEPQRLLAGQRAEVQSLQHRVKQAVEITPKTRHGPGWGLGGATFAVAGPGEDCPECRRSSISPSSVTRHLEQGTPHVAIQATAAPRRRRQA